MIETIAIFIPIIALSIPIVAIIANTYAKTHSGANPALKDKIHELESKILELQTSNNHLEDTVNQLEEKAKEWTASLSNMLDISPVSNKKRNHRKISR